MVLQEKVRCALWELTAVIIVKAMNEVAKQYKIIAMNNGSSSDDIIAADNFGRYAFQGTSPGSDRPRPCLLLWTDPEEGKEILYPMSGLLIRSSLRRWVQERSEDVLSGGADCRRRLPQAFPDGFRPLPDENQGLRRGGYLYGDWDPDSLNLAKQSRQMGINLPFANIWIYNANTLLEVGIEGGKGWVHVGPYHSPVPFSAAPGFYRVIQDLEQTMD